MADPVDETEMPADAPTGPPPVSGGALGETALPVARERDWGAVLRQLAGLATPYPSPRPPPGGGGPAGGAAPPRRGGGGWGPAPRQAGEARPPPPPPGDGQGRLT